MSGNLLAGCRDSPSGCEHPSPEQTESVGQVNGTGTLGCVPGRAGRRQDGTMPRPVPRHDRDAGGPAETLAAKAALREEIWSAMSADKGARFPGAAGRIPNFTGAEAAAERL